MNTSSGIREYLKRYESLLEEKKKGHDEFTTEFQKVKRESEKMSKDGICTSVEGAKEHNKKKNRYKDILPFDHSRVILKSKNKIEGTDFINANYIKSPEGRMGYIASQGPLPSTVNDFWRMIWQHKIKIIVMACKEIELGKHRCQRYWPLEGDELVFDQITVTLINVKSLDDNLVERQIRATYGSDELLLSQVHYTAWPDHGAPRTTRDIIRLIEFMREIHPWDDPPVLVHCSAGCGRTGAIVAIDYGRRILRKMPEKFSVLELVVMLRKQRPAMVQSKEQYEYLYEVFKDLINEQLKSLSSRTDPLPYVNVDFSTPKEVVPIYENCDASPVPTRKAPPKGRPVPVPGGATQLIRGNLGEARKPIITNHNKTPQQAMIRAVSEPSHPQLPPKSAPKPVNLLDDVNGKNNALPAPLLPDNSSPVQCQPIKPQIDKDWAPNNYINVFIGQPKTKPALPSNKPPVSSKKPDASQQNPHDVSRGLSSPEKPKRPSGEDRRPVAKSRSLETSLEDLNAANHSPPELPAKPSHPQQVQLKVRGMMKSKSAFDLADGDRPPLPRKNRDLHDFDSHSNGSGRLCSENEVYRSRGNRTEHHESIAPANASSPPQVNGGVTMKHQDQSVDAKAMKKNRNEKEPLRTAFSDQRALKSDNPFSVSNYDKPHKAATLPRDGLVARTSSKRAEAKRDLSESRTPFVVTVQKSDPKVPHQNSPGPDITASNRPTLFKNLSAGEIVVSNSKPGPVSGGGGYVETRSKSPNFHRSPVAVNKDRRAPLLLDLAEEHKSNTEQDKGENGPVYGVVQKPPAKPAEQGVYERIWSPTKKSSETFGPPALPLRTSESFMIIDDNHYGDSRPDSINFRSSTSSAEEKSTLSDESPHSATSDQSSIQWLSVGVDRIKKKLAPITAFSSSSRSNRSARASADNPDGGSTGQILSPKSENLVFSNRLDLKPKGPRPMPNKWLPVKYSRR
eukprot:gene5971-6667_t